MGKKHLRVHTLAQPMLRESAIGLVRLALFLNDYFLARLRPCGRDSRPAEFLLPDEDCLTLPFAFEGVARTGAWRGIGAGRWARCGGAVLCCGTDR